MGVSRKELFHVMDQLPEQAIQMAYDYMNFLLQQYSLPSPESKNDVLEKEIMNHIWFRDMIKFCSTYKEIDQFVIASFYSNINRLHGFKGKEWVAKVKRKVGDYDEVAHIITNILQGKPISERENHSVPFQVKIKKCSRHDSWYRDHIDKEFVVIEAADQWYVVKNPYGNGKSKYVVLHEDCYVHEPTRQEQERKQASIVKSHPVINTTSYSQYDIDYDLDHAISNREMDHDFEWETEQRTLDDAIKEWKNNLGHGLSTYDDRDDYDY